VYLFFYGPNVYEMNKKLSALREKFLLSDPSGINLSQLSGENITLAGFFSEISSAPFLANKRLIIIRNLLIDNKDGELKKSIAENLSKIPDTAVVVFAESGSPDKRTSLFRALNKPKISQVFDLLSPLSFNTWIRNYFKKEGLSISAKACEKMSAYLENDQTRGENEIKKLLLYAKSQKGEQIEEEDIELLVKGGNSANIFEFIEAVAKKEKKKAFLALKTLKEAGQNEIYILSMIAYQFRTLLIISDFLSRNLRPKEIALQAKMHPFVINKSIDLLRGYSKDRLKKLYNDLKNADLSIKSGKLDPSLCLDLVVNNFVA